MFDEDLLQTIIDQSKEWRELFGLNSEIHEAFTFLIDLVEKYQKNYSYEVDRDDPEIPEPKTK